MLMQAVMEAEVVRKTGAGLGERSPERLTHRNGYRALDCLWRLDEETDLGRVKASLAIA